MRSQSHLNPKLNHTHPIRPVIAIVVLVLVALASVLVPVGTHTAEAQSSPTVIETFALEVHGNGSQMKVTRVELNDDHTLVVFEVINGRDFPTQFNASTRDTRIEDDRGRSYALLSAFQAIVEPGHASQISLGFAPVPASTDSISFFFRDRDGDSNDVREGFPSFRFDDIDLTQDIDEPALPANLTIDESETHPNGTTFIVESLEFENAFTRVMFEARNPTDRRVDLSNGRHQSFIEDNLGNRYYMKLADNQAFLRLSDGRRFDGTLPFAGRIHPDATSIKLVMNHDKSSTDERTSTPKFVMGPWTISEGEPGDIVPIEIDETQTHANESELTLERIEFTSEGALLDFNYDNPGDGLVFLNGCCDHSYLLDDLGNQYLLLRLEDNASLRVNRGRGISGTIGFAGEMDPSASEITVVFNDRDEDGSDESTIYPKFSFGPYELERTEAASLTDDDDDDGDAGSLDEILEDFDARAGRRIVTLTVPADGLFEPGEDTLEEGRVFDQLLQVLELYEGEEILIVAHTDAEGSSSSNLRTSERQADALLEGLGDAGFDTELVVAIGEGEDKPVVDDDSADSREANRRIKITIFTTDGLPD